MTPDKLVIAAALRILGDAFKSNEAFQKKIIQVVLVRLEKSPWINAQTDAVKLALAKVVLEEIFK